MNWGRRRGGPDFARVWRKCKHALAAVAAARTGGGERVAQVIQQEAEVAVGVRVAGALLHAAQLLAEIVRLPRTDEGCKVAQ